MALSLKDLQKIKEEKKKLGVNEKKSVLRPWQSFEGRGIETRTIRAKEALVRAKNIVEENNDMVSSIREGIVSEDEIVQWDMKLEVRQEKFEFKDDEFELRKRREVDVTKERTGIFGFLKELF